MVDEIGKPLAVTGVQKSERKIISGDLDLTNPLPSFRDKFAEILKRLPTASNIASEGVYLGNSQTLASLNITSKPISDYVV